MENAKFQSCNDFFHLRLSSKKFLMPALFNDLFQEVVEGTLTRDQAELYLDASEKVRRFLNDYLNLKFPLYYHYTHLVCRTALDGKLNGMVLILIVRVG